MFGDGYDKTRAFRAQLANFARAIRGAEPLVITPDDAVASVDVIEAAYRSLRAAPWTGVTARATHDLTRTPAPRRAMPDTDPDFALEDNTLTYPTLGAMLADLGPPPCVHPTAIVEAGVSLGRGTSVWDSVHIRHDTTIGDECIVGEKTYIAYGVRIGHRVKINAWSTSAPR